jgi:hypothetical protein
MTASKRHARRWISRRRGAQALAVGVILAMLVGDGHTTPTGGIDPLEILNLSVKPNVIVVLDSSGSMAETVGGSGLPNGDWPDSKMAKAKQVLNTLVASNEDKVTFLFGQYTQTGAGVSSGSTRFVYRTTATASPDMATNEIRIRRALDDTTAESRGLQDWQNVQTGWDTLYYRERISTGSITSPFAIGSGTNDQLYFRERAGTNSKFRSCTITIPAALYATYDTHAKMGVLAAALTERMNTTPGHPDTSCVEHGSSLNAPNLAFSVTWDSSTARFTITRTQGGSYQILDDDSSSLDNVLNNLGFSDDVPAAADWSNDTPTSWPTSPTSTWSNTAAINGAVIGTPGTSTDVNCSTTIAAGFYVNGADLAAAMQNAMNSDGCPGSSPNTYTVTYDGNDGDFNFARSAGSADFQLRWSATPENIGVVLGATTTDTSLDSSTKITTDARIMVHRFDSYERAITGDTEYWMYSRRFLNGHVITVNSADRVCDFTTGTPTNPPTVIVNKLSGTACNTAQAATATFTLNGGNWTGASNTCDGFQSKVPLSVCNSATSQFSVISPFLRNELALTADGLNPESYVESTNGLYSIVTQPTGGIVADGATPIADSLEDIKPIFDAMWSGTAHPAIGPGVDAISGHTNPKERTIVLFVTDGDDTCADVGSGSGGDERALAAAYRAQVLYQPIANLDSSSPTTPSGGTGPGIKADGSLNTGTAPTTVDPASSVSTYIVGFGSGASLNRLNWIAWAGSGMRRTTTTDGSETRWSTAPTGKGACTNCRDAFIAPDADTLEDILQSIIDQGATAGSFTAQQSITAAVYELSAEVPGFGPNDPRKRYEALVPNQFQASFDLPGFRGRVRALQNDAGTVFTKWEAGDKLLTRVQTGMNAIAPLRSGAATGQGTFSQLHAGATDSNIAASGAAIKRRIYTTSKNGSFTLGSGGIFDANLSSLRTGTSPNRVPLWPPTTAGGTSTAPADDLTQGVLDPALGLPSNSQITAGAAAQLSALQSTFKACLGTPLPAACSGTPEEQAQRARREAREMILAYTAGAEVLLDSAGNPARVSSGTEAGEILYQARAWILAESTLAPPAVVAPPIATQPTNFGPEYVVYRDSPQASGVAQNGLSQGFGLRNAEGSPSGFDSLTPSSGNDTRTALKPAMSVVYVPANDMLHAFRAGPSCGTPGGVGASATYSSCSEQGGEELWGFVPFDRLAVLKNLLFPQTRDNKVFMLAAPVRFADVWVDAPGGSMTAGVGSASVSGRGMWRQVLMFGRGQGGKYLTVLDVTGRGAYTTASLNTQAPIVWWSRGNPDTDDGTNKSGDSPSGTGTQTNDNFDYSAYKKMGETWSVPAISFVDRSKNVTARRSYDASTGSGGVPMVAYLGSGYCNPCNAGEGTTFFTLDVTTGDVVAAVDVEQEAADAGVQRTGLSYANALVASPVAFNATEFRTIGGPGHPADPVTRVYIGDLHGRLWKFLSSDPTQALLLADLGADQPVGTAGALLGLPGDAPKPFIYVTSGHDSRAPANTGFKLFGFRDDGDDTTATYGSATATTDPDVNVYSPGAYLFSKDLGTNFRGTIQPATALNTANSGRVFFGGTRFNEPGTAFAPAPPPCRSSFDSVIFALGAETGGAAYDLNSSGSDEFVIFSNSRKTALQVIKQPTPTGTPTAQGKGVLVIDEGLMGSGSVTPPPPPGLQPQIPAAPIVALALPDPTDPRRFAQFSSPRLCQ